MNILGMTNMNVLTLLTPKMVEKLKLFVVNIAKQLLKFLKIGMLLVKKRQKDISTIDNKI